MPLCTVVIINYNTWDHLERCLNALVRQTFKNFSVLLVDNSSEEMPSPSILQIFPRTSYIKNSQNRGFAGANNQAFSKTDDSEWIILLNPDVFPEADFIEQLLDAAYKYSGFKMFGARLFFDDRPDLVEGDGDCYHVSGLAWRNRTISGKQSPFEVFTACAAALMVKTDIVQKVGGFDEDFFCYMEDVDLGFRMRLGGHRCLIIPEARAYHVGSASSGGQHSDFAVYHGHRNIVWTYIKNMPAPLLWLFLPLHLALNLVAILWFALRGQQNVILKAKMDALLGFPTMWRKRKNIQKQRVATLSEILHFMDKNPIPLYWIKKKTLSN
jgi:GT2 family glycosyltransferase